MNHKAMLILLSFCLQASCLSAQDSIPFDETNWEFSGDYELTTHLGKPAVRLDKARATSIQLDFRNGIIRYKVAFTADRGFVGIDARMKDEANYEEFYMRAHQSGNPDAMQYTPVYNGIAGWQIHVGEGYSGAHQYQFDRWMEVKLVFRDQELEIFIDDMETPVLYANNLEYNESGGVALYSAMKTAYFADVRIESLENPEIVSDAKPGVIPEPGIIPAWQVSLEAFDYEAQAQVKRIAAEMIQDFHWMSIEANHAGLTNLAKAGGLEEGKNTRWAMVTIEAEEAQVVKMDLGYSDAILVYVNGVLVYGGSRVFRSRDYRYLGTIGYFDQLYLPLKAGENEIICAVGEVMGGWAIQAKIYDLDGKVVE